MKITVLSGGTASNELVSMFNNLSDDVSYVLPVSDNGGSTAELIRVLSGPAVGDIRSRLTRLIPEDDKESVALKNLLTYRLSADPELAKHEWLTIVDGSNAVWDQIEPSCKEMIRSFLIHVHMELLKRSRQSSRNFKYELASVGNLFLTGGRLFCGSLDSAIELFLRLTRVPKGIRVLPCLNTNFTYHISALLENDLIITGQSQISHPSTNEEEEAKETTLHHSLNSSTDLGLVRTGKISSNLKLNSWFNMSNSSLNDDLLINKYQDLEMEEYATPSYFHPDLKKSNLHFNKDDQNPLPSPISRIFYISPYGEEIHPMAHTRVLTALRESKAIVYSIGSLMTSTIPILILQGVGNAILRHSPDKKKIMLLNGSNDRETSSLTASGFVRFVVKSIEYSMKLERAVKGMDGDTEPDIDMLDWSKYVTHLMHLPEHHQIELDFDVLEKHGIKCVEVASRSPGFYDIQDLELKMQELI